MVTHTDDKRADEGRRQPQLVFVSHQTPSDNRGSVAGKGELHKGGREGEGGGRGERGGRKGGSNAVNSHRRVGRVHGLHVGSLKGSLAGTLKNQSTGSVMPKNSSGILWGELYREMTSKPRRKKPKALANAS